MERIQHFSHSEHPLILKKLGEEEEEFVCYGCHEAITENDVYYACEEDCPGFYLHKKCRDLPREINLPIHTHRLTLFASYPYSKGSTCTCNICGRNDWKWFTYHCSLCDFDIDVICGSILQEGNITLEHEGHPHPLTFILKPSLFNCDACNTNDTTDSSYFCNTCQFWIHKSCATAPKSITVAHHDHDDPLLLSYSLPPQHRNFTQFCSVCQKKVHPSDWVYCCDNCRHFNHLKCAFAATATTGESEIQAKEGDTDLFSKLMKLPLPNHESLDPLSLFVTNNNTSKAYDDNGATDIYHRLHDHPLSIHNDPHIITSNLQAYCDILCDGCVRPISVPFYSCTNCNFFLHSFCAELPEEVLCPHDPEHSIKVKMYENCYNLFQCSFCLKICNGFFYQCVSCEIDLDIGCASDSIPSTIIHDSHQHPLVRCHLPIESHLKCKGCGDNTGVNHTYSCKACSYNLCINCVSYPGSLRHEYDIHDIPLRYPPIKDHPSDFICEICEQDINTNHWMYHCHHCNQSFHASCLSPLDWASNIKFGGTVNIDGIHQHPLTFVRNRESEFPSLCDQCGGDRNGSPMLECAPCGFKLCGSCATQSED